MSVFMGKGIVKTALVAMVALSVAFSIQAKAEADLSAGKAAARVCGSCHGIKGIANVPSYPSLAGQSAQYLAKQLRAFRDGSRNDPQMTAMAQHLSDKQIIDISGWYNSLSACKPGVKK